MSTVVLAAFFPTKEEVLKKVVTTALEAEIDGLLDSLDKNAFPPHKNDVRFNCTKG